MRNWLLLTLGSVVMLLIGCEENEILELPDGTAYFPLEIGLTTEYRVDSIIFDDVQGGNRQDTFTRLMRERIYDTFVDATGDTSYLVEQSTRLSENDDWQVTRLLAARVQNLEAVAKEGNLDFIKMRFPMRENLLWNPTQFFDPTIAVPVGTELIEAYSNWQGSVLSLGLAETIGAQTFNNVLTVTQANDDNEIERRYVMEKYADGVGLVLRVDTILDSRCKRLGDLLPCLDEINGELVSQPWTVKAEKGYIMRKELTAHN